MPKKGWPEVVSEIVPYLRQFSVRRLTLLILCGFAAWALRGGASGSAASSLIIVGYLIERSVELAIEWLRWWNRMRQTGLAQAGFSEFLSEQLEVAYKRQEAPPVAPSESIPDSISPEHEQREPAAKPHATKRVR